MEITSSAVDVLPPYGNTGVLNTLELQTDYIPRPKIDFVLDWLQFTIKDIHTIEDAIMFLDVDADTVKKSTISSNKMYATMYMVSNKIRIYLDGKNEDYNVGVHFEMSGQACRYYETVVGDLITLLARIVTFDYKIARLDPAVDIYRREGEYDYFDLDMLEEMIKRNYVRMKFRKSRVVSQYGHSSTIDMDAINLGKTLYLGSEKSDMQIRIYDKLKERIVNGVHIDESIKNWSRVELMLRDDRANEAVKKLISYDGMQFVKGILSNNLNFIVPSKDSNKARWPVAHWWTEFLGDVDKIKLAKGHKPISVERTESWLNHQVSPSMAFYILAHAGDLSKLHTMILEAMEKLTPEQRIIAEEHAEEYMKSLYDKQEMKYQNNIDDMNEYRRKRAVEAYYNQHL